MATLPPPKDESCDRCGFARYRQYGEAQVIECRFNAPIGLGTRGTWPQVQETDWCGHYAAPGA